MLHLLAIVDIGPNNIVLAPVIVETVPCNHFVNHLSSSFKALSMRVRFYLNPSPLQGSPNAKATRTPNGQRGLSGCMFAIFQ